MSYYDNPEPAIDAAVQNASGPRAVYAVHVPGKGWKVTTKHPRGGSFYIVRQGRDIVHIHPGDQLPILHARWPKLPETALERLRKLRPQSGGMFTRPRQ